MTTFVKNEQLNGIEIKFDIKPGADVLERLKAAGFRWHKQKGVWYAKNNPETLELAQAICSDESENYHGEEEPKKNALCVLVGDLFRMSWGYEQTNVDWFQVVSLIGSSSVRVREVCPPVIKEEGVCWAASYNTYETSTRTHATVKNPLWIKDQERGDIKRVFNGYGEVPSIKIGNHYARLVTSDKMRVYESWYA